MGAPWAAKAGHTKMISRVHSFGGAKPGGFCFYGAAQAGRLTETAGR